MLGIPWLNQVIFSFTSYISPTRSSVTPVRGAKAGWIIDTFKLSISFCSILEDDLYSTDILNSVIGAIAVLHQLVLVLLSSLSIFKIVASVCSLTDWLSNQRGSTTIPSILLTLRSHLDSWRGCWFPGPGSLSPTRDPTTKQTCIELIIRLCVPLLVRGTTGPPSGV
jgi:hypothetical protein